MRKKPIITACETNMINPISKTQAVNFFEINLQSSLRIGYH